jgi:hypothetical protein
MAEVALNLPVRSGKAVLALGLTRLARHYGMVNPHKLKSRDLTAHWAMDD